MFDYNLVWVFSIWLFYLIVIVYLMQLDNLIEQSSLTLLLFAVQPIWSLELTQKVIQHKKKPLLL